MSQRIIKNFFILNGTKYESERVKNLEAITRDALDNEGFFPIGDIGYIDEVFLYREQILKKFTAVINFHCLT